MEKEIAELEKKIADLTKKIDNEEQCDEYKKLIEAKNSYERLVKDIKDIDERLRGKFSLDRSDDKEKEALRKEKEKLEKERRKLNSSVEKLKRRNARIKENWDRIAKYKSELEELQHAQERGDVKPEELIGRAFTIRIQGRQGGR